MKKLPLAWNLPCNIYVHAKILSCKSQREHPKKYNMAHICCSDSGRFFYSLHLQHVQRGSCTYLPYNTYWNVPGVIWYTLRSETSPPLPLRRRASRPGLRCDSYSCRCVFTSARLPGLVRGGATRDVTAYAISQQPSAHFIHPCEVRFALLPLPLTSPCGVLCLLAEWVRG